jgi:hypothetical protein
MSSSSIATSSITSGFIDLATYDELEKYLCGGQDSIAYFVREVSKCTWFTQIPVSIARSSGSPNFGQQWSVQLSRAGDYLIQVWLRATFPDVATPATAGYNDTRLLWCHNPMHSLIREAALTFNDLTSMRFDNYFLDFWANFTIDSSKRQGYDTMIGANVSNFSADSAGTTYAAGGAGITTLGRTLSLPLPFFFTRDSGVALPTAALPYNDMRIQIEFRDWRQMLLLLNDNTGVVRNAVDADLLNPSNCNLRDVNIWANYAIVSNDERRRMGCGGREILIEQVQTLAPQPFNPSTIETSLNYDIRFAHAVKALFFGVRNKTVSNDHGNYSCVQVAATGSRPAVGLFNPLRRAALIYESTIRMEMDIDYFSLINPYYHAVSIPSEPGYNMYSYSLNLTSLDPMGSTNYGKLTNASFRVMPSQVAIDAIDGSLSEDIPAQSFDFFVVALNHNIIRVSGGTLGFPIL